MERNKPGASVRRQGCAREREREPRRCPAPDGGGVAVRIAKALRRMLPSASCQGVGVLKLGVFRGSITWPVIPPVYASYLAWRPCPKDSEPLWLVAPSSYSSFIRYTLPVWCGLHRTPRRSLLLPSKNTVLTHRLLALRHGAYAPAVGAATRHPGSGAAKLPEVPAAGTC